MNNCVSCGDDIPEGRQVCPKCEAIADSGNRREFSTGAIRDIQEGKGRCDLLPLDIVSKLLDDEVLNFMSRFLNSKEPIWLYRSVGEFIMNRSDFTDIYDAMLEVSIRFENGAKKYGEYNWQKGIPIQSYIDSAIRHYLKFRRGDIDERHDQAFVWNILCCLWTFEHGYKE